MLHAVKVQTVTELRSRWRDATTRSMASGAGDIAATHIIALELGLGGNEGATDCTNVRPPPADGNDLTLPQLLCCLAGRQ